MRYRRTQFGWVLVLGLAIPAAILVAVALAGGNWTPLIGLIPILVVIPLFGWLAVSLDDDAVVVRFGIGVITYRIPLSGIVTTEVVHNPWTWGWGVRIIPGGRLYNVSGLRGVEFALADGSRVRVGTNDPEGLQAAVRDVVPPGRVAHRTEIGAPPTIARGVAVIVMVVVAAILVLLWLATRPVSVSTSNGILAIDGGGYHTRIPLNDVRGVRLDQALPVFRMRTNGVGVGGELRGHFRLADGRAAQVFVSRAHPPFITVETTADPVIVNMSNAASTRRLYDELVSLVRAQ